MATTKAFELAQLSALTTVDGGIDISGNITDQTIVGSTSDSTADALNIRDSNADILLRVRNDGVVLIEDNYLYVTASTGAYFDGSIKARGGIHNDTAGAKLSLSDTEGVNVSSTTTSTSSTTGALIVGGGVGIAENLNVGGDLTVEGSTVTLNTTDLNVEDKNITLNYHATADTSTAADQAGITIQDAVDASNDASILWDQTNSEFDVSHSMKIGGSVGVTNIVTNKVVKFDGNILDDSNITDTGSKITLGSDTWANGVFLSTAGITSPGSAGTYTYNASAFDYAAGGMRTWSWGSSSARGTYSFIQLKEDGDNQQTAVFIDANGRVGINQGIPTYGLEVNNAKTTNDGTLYVNAALNGSGNGLVINSNSRTTNDNADLLLKVIDRSNNVALSTTVSGRVGVGTGAARGSLEVYNTSETSDRDGSATHIMSGQDSIVLHGHSTVDTATYGSITWEGGDRRRAMITGVAEAGDADFLGLAFYTQGTDGAGDFFESMRISRSGNVGIGVTSPAPDKLYVEDGDIGINNTSGRRYRLISEVGGGFTIRDQSAGAGRYQIDTSGNTTLTRGSTDQTDGLTLTNTQPGGYGSALVWKSKRSDGAQAIKQSAKLVVAGENSWNSDNDTASQMQFWTQKDNTLTKHMTLTKNGNLGVGIAATDSRLHVHSAADTQIRISADNSMALHQDAAWNSNIYFGAYHNGSNVVYGKTGRGAFRMINLHDGDSSPQYIAFHGANAGTAGDTISWNTVGLAMDEDGKVGIGTTNPQALLEISKTTAGLISGGSGNKGATLRLHHEAQWEGGYGNTPTNPDFLGSIDFSTGDSSTGEGVKASIRTSVESYYNTNHLNFYTADGSGSTSMVERLSIQQNGRIVLNRGTTDYEPTHTDVVKNYFTAHTDYNAQGTQHVSLSHLNGNWLDGTTGSDSQYGMLFGYNNQTRGGIIYDHRSTEMMTMWSSYAPIRFMVPDAADGDGLPTDANINTALTLEKGGKVGVHTEAPKANFHVDTGGSSDGFAVGGKNISLNTTFQTGAQLEISLGDHQACYVKVFLTGDWSGHSAMAFLGEYFIQNGANAYQEAGSIIREVDHTGGPAADYVSSMIYDGGNYDSFQIQFKLNTSSGVTTSNGMITYQVMGQFDSIT